MKWKRREGNSNEEEGKKVNEKEEKREKGKRVEGIRARGRCVEVKGDDI